MYFVLYDRQLNTIGSTYILESWSRTRRAFDYDDAEIEGEQIPANAEPFFVVVNDKRGHMSFSGLASTPINDDKTLKTKIVLKDYRTLFNSDIVVNWSLFTGTTLKALFDFVLNIWKTQNGEIGFDNILFDTSALDTLLLDSDIELGQESESFDTYQFLSENMAYYSVWVDISLDVHVKSLTFTFKRVGTEVVPIKLSDFGVTKIEKDFGEYNQATVYTDTLTKHGAWCLTADNQIAKLPNTEIQRLYPVKNRNFIASSAETADLNSAIYEAIMGLAENRYAENFDLDATQYKAGDILYGLDFSTAVQVYTPEGYYKTLPVGSIEQDNKDKYIVGVGYRAQELTQIL